MEKIRLALYFGNRGFFPGELIADARRELAEAVSRNGLEYLMMDPALTRYGGVETLAEGKRFAEFLEENRGKYDGIILCLPNFGDENGALEALREVTVPILVQVYPDEPDKMDFSHRRDALCGKIAMCNCLRQRGIRYSLTAQPAVHPLTKEFDEDLRVFAGVCRVVKGMKRLRIGAIGARTTAFKTVRIDEIAMENKGIGVETVDLSQVFARMREVPPEAVAFQKSIFGKYRGWEAYPPVKLEQMARLAAVLKDLIEEMELHAVAIRCWPELEQQLQIAPCLAMAELNEHGIPAACEMDVSNAVMMRALSLASDSPVMLLDVNNNGAQADECILFHCSAIPASFMGGPGQVKEHLMFRKSYGQGSGAGIHVGKILPGEVTFGSLKTEAGQLWAFVAQGDLTDAPVGKDFFGCGVVLKKEGMDQVLTYLCENGYRHHVAIVKGRWQASVAEALTKYLGYQTQIL